MVGDDVVIVVPALDNVQMEPVGSHSHHICIDADNVDIEPNMSPKTITESSSKLKLLRS